jgi:hypothetical protein
MQVNVKQEGVSQRYANHGERVSYSQPGGPLVVTEAKEAVQCNYEVAGMPGTDAECKNEEDTLERSEPLGHA